MSTQIQNLKNLLRIGEQIVTDRKGDFGFGLWNCGTYACLGGHYDRECNARIGQVKRSEGAAHFGISEQEFEALFRRMDERDASRDGNEPSEAAYTELERRLGILRKLIAAREPKHVGIHASVRAIFDTAQSPALC